MSSNRSELRKNNKNQTNMVSQVPKPAKPTIYYQYLKNNL